MTFVFNRLLVIKHGLKGSQGLDFHQRAIHLLYIAILVDDAVGNIQGVDVHLLRSP
ncbi:hypothetical protein J4727_18145 [Providencia rettgeri]|uniref:Uncharacterized protein n=1 Tax=Providencia rettgeri TaxID=587 RepID=A0A939NH26_PRORE|nr:hypothetical protein [Providencia rettgeri]